MFPILICFISVLHLSVPFANQIRFISTDHMMEAQQIMMAWGREGNLVRLGDRSGRFVNVSVFDIDAILFTDQIRSITTHHMMEAPQTMRT